jgi:hypothetical protein
VDISLLWAGHEPARKVFTDFKDCVHPRQPTFMG